MIQAMYLDWKIICMKIQQSIKTKPRNEQSNMIVHFGEKRVVIRSQTYCRMVLSLLIQFQLFGKEFVKIQAYVIMKSKKRVLLHIASSEAAKSLFTIAGLCAFKVELGNDLIASCCGKVNIKFNSSL